MPRDHVAPRKWGVLQALDHRRALLFRQAREEVDAPDRRHAALHVAFPHGVGMRLVFLDQVHGLLGLRNPYPYALECGEQVHAHPRVGRIVVGQVGEEIAQRETQVAVLESEQHAGGLGSLRDVGDFSFADRGLGRCDYARRRHAGVDVKIDPAPPLQRRAFALAQHLELALHEHAVRDHHGFPIARLHRSETPADVGHAADHVVDFDPVTHADRIVELQRKAAEHVTERVLHRERKHGRDDCRSGENPAEVEAETTQMNEREHDVRTRDDEVFDDARGPQPDQRQQQAEDRESAQAHDRDRSHHDEHREQHLGDARIVHHLHRRARELPEHAEDEQRQRIAERRPLQGTQTAQ